MRLPKFFPSWLIVFLAIPLLGMLAYNQFNWLQELQQRELERIKLSMLDSVSVLSDKVIYEIRLLPNLLSVEPEGPTGDPETIRRQIRFWRTYARNPEIVKDLYYIDTENDAVSHWNGNAFTVVKGEEGRAMLKNGPVSETESEIRTLSPLRSPAGPRGLILCVFDKAAILDGIIPSIAAETFKNNALYDYRIVDERDWSVIFRSSQEYREDAFAKPDVSTKLFSDPVKKLEDMSRTTQESDFRKSGSRNRDMEAEPRAMPSLDFQPDKMRDFIPEFSREILPYLRVEIVNKDGALESLSRQSTIQNAILSFTIVIILFIVMIVLAEASRSAHELALRQNEFVATVTHELKTPLAVITSAAQNLADGFVSGQEKTRQYGNMMKREASRLGVSIEHFLLYSRTSPQKRSKPELCDIGDLVDSALKFTEDERLANGFETEVRLPDYPVFVSGDRIALESVFRNLAQNVIRHAREGRYMGIIVLVAPVKNRKGLQNVVINIRDKGPGISAREKREIFEPFVRGKYAVSNQIPGNGIGLNLVKRIVTVHGGTVSLESKLGAGSTFIVTLPESGGEIHGNQDSDDRG